MDELIDLLKSYVDERHISEGQLYRRLNELYVEPVYESNPTLMELLHCFYRQQAGEFEGDDIIYGFCLGALSLFDEPRCVSGTKSGSSNKTIYADLKIT